VTASKPIVSGKQHGTELKKRTGKLTLKKETTMQTTRTSTGGFAGDGDQQRAGVLLLKSQLALAQLLNHLGLDHGPSLGVVARSGDQLQGGFVARLGQQIKSRDVDLSQDSCRLA